MLNTPDKTVFYKNADRFIELYEGILMAVNELKEQGVSMELFVYDTENNPEKVKSILLKPELEQMDILFGPVYHENVKIAAEFAKNNHIALVSPLSQKDDLLTNNPFLFQVAPSFTSLTQGSAKYFSTLQNAGIIVVHEGTPDELDIIKTYKDNLVRTFFYDKNAKEIVFKEINYKVSGISGVDDAMSLGLNNIIIIPSTNEIFVSNVLQQLMSLQKIKKYNIMLYGMPAWERFRNIDLEFLQKLNLHYPSANFVDYSNENVKDFVLKYRNAFNTEPSLFSFQGYDMAKFFLSNLKKYGKYFEFCFTENSEFNVGLSIDNKYVKSNENNGFENKSVYILRYDEFLNLQKTEIK